MARSVGKFPAHAFKPWCCNPCRCLHRDYHRVGRNLPTLRFPLIDRHWTEAGLYQLSLPVNICQYITQSARNDNQGCEKEAGRFFS